MEGLVAILSVEALFRLALCGVDGYAAASLREDVWESACSELELPRSQYDRCWLDTFARSLRQALFRGSVAAPWVHSSKMVTSGIILQFRKQEDATNMIAWVPTSPIPWFTLTSLGMLYVYADTDGTRRPCPTPSLLTSLYKHSDVSDPLAKCTKMQQTLVTGGTLKGACL